MLDTEVLGGVIAGFIVIEVAQDGIWTCSAVRGCRPEAPPSGEASAPHLMTLGQGVDQLHCTAEIAHGLSHG
jgi:hypothetical protein